MLEEKIREANAEKAAIGQTLQGLITQSEENAAKIVDLKNRLNSVLQEHVNSNPENTKIQADLPWILRAQADIIESLVAQRNTMENQYRGSLSMSKDLLANRDILNKAKEDQMNTSKHSHQHSGSNQTSTEVPNAEDGLRTNFLTIDGSKNAGGNNIKFASKDFSLPESQSALFNSQEDSQEQLYLMGAKKLEISKSQTFRSDSGFFSKMSESSRQEEARDIDFTNINSSSKHGQLYIPQLKLPQRSSNSSKQINNNDTESLHQYEESSASNIERTETIPPMRLSNIYKKLLSTSQSHVNQQPSRLTFADQRQFTAEDISPSREAKSHIESQRPINIKTLDISLSRASANSAYSKLSSPSQRLPVVINEEINPSFMSNNSHTERTSDRYHNLNKALFSNKSFEKDSMSKSYSEISQIMPQRRDEIDEQLEVHSAELQTSTAVFNRAAGTIPCQLSNFSENLAQNMVNKTPVKPKARLLNVHKNVINYKSLKDKIIEKKETVDSSSNLNRSCNLSRNASDVTPNKFTKLLEDVTGNSEKRVTSLTARQTPLTNRTSSNQKSNSQSNRNSFKNSGSLSSRAPIDHKKVFRRPSTYHQENGREISINLKSFLEHKRKLFHTSDVVHYHDKFDMASPYHPMYTQSMLDMNNNSHNSSQSRVNLSQI